MSPKRNIFYYQAGQSNENALHHVITHTEEASDSMLLDITIKVTDRHGTGDTICQ